MRPLGVDIRIAFVLFLQPFVMIIDRCDASDLQFVDPHDRKIRHKNPPFRAQSRRE
jgi:hypothetical protein